jgi:hypothetical protein
MAGSAVGNGTYKNNFFIQASKSLVFNSTNKTHLAVPDMIINDATVGINTSTPNTTYKLDVNGNINGLILYESGVSLASKYLSLGRGSLTGALTVNGNININSSGTNRLIFDNALNGKKIEISPNNYIGVDGNGMVFSSSAQFRFAKGTNIYDSLFTVSSVGDLSFAGTIYSGAISTSGDIITVRNITATTNVSAASFTEGGVALSTKYLTSASTATTFLKLDGTNYMTGNLGIGKANPNCKLYIDSANGNTTSTTFSIRIGANGTISDSGAYPNLIGLGIEANGWSKGAI